MRPDYNPDVALFPCQTVPSLILVLALAVAAGAVSAAQGSSEPADLEKRKLLIALLKQEPEGFASAKAPWNFRFPADHAAHPDFWTESWHFTGSGSSSRGRRFGFQLTFLRIGLIPTATPLGPSAWAARDVYWAQFALTDAGANRTHATERISRAAMGFAGAQQSPVRVWLEDWMVEVHSVSGQSEAFELRATDRDIRIELSLRSAKRAVISGRDEQESTNAVNTFHAYAMTRLLGKGTIQVGRDIFEVDGSAWLDRAWGRIPVPVGAVVWDRLMVQLDDGSELMVLRMRRRDGSGQPTVTGMLVDSNGFSRILPNGTLHTDVLEYWSDRYGTKHPVAWRVRVPKEELDLLVTSIVAGQERRLSFLSWAGAMRASGTAKRRPIEGSGYMELAATQ